MGLRMDVLTDAYGKGLVMVESVSHYGCLITRSSALRQVMQDATTQCRLIRVHNSKALR